MFFRSLLNIINSNCAAYGNQLAVQEDVVVVKIQYRLGALGFLKVEGGGTSFGLFISVPELAYSYLSPSNVTISQFHSLTKLL